MAIVSAAVLAVSTVVLLPAPSLAAPAVSAATAEDPIVVPPVDGESGTPPAQTQVVDDENCDTNYDGSGNPVSGTCTYGPKGSAYQIFRPPAEVGRVSVVAYGAQGGNSSSAGGGTPGTGGLGGSITGTIDVSGGRNLVLLVGNQGGSQRFGGDGGMGGWPGGGDGGYSPSTSTAGCGGGGSTRIDDATTTLLEAGGGGGCGGYFTPMTGASGGRGGIVPTGGGTGQSSGLWCNTANGYAGTGGGAASLGGGGAKGVQGQYLGAGAICYGGNSHSANPGSADMGGNGSDGEGIPIRGTGGGGGGGGSFGGGGGGGGQQNVGDGSGGGGGGGGGSNGYGGAGVSVTGWDSGVRSGNGSLTISWDYTWTAVSVSATDYSGNPVTSVKAGNQVKFVATMVSPNTVTGHTGGVTFRDSTTGIPLCEGTPQTPVLLSIDPNYTRSTATCTFQWRNTVPPPAQCVVPPPSDPPPPPLPPECNFNSSTAKTLNVTASYAPGNATSAASSGALPFTIAPGEVYTRVLGSSEPNTVRVFAAPYIQTVPIDGTITVFYEDDTPVPGCVDLTLTWTIDVGLASCYVPLVPGTTRVLHAFYTGGPNTESARNFDYYDFAITAGKIPTTTDLALIDGTRTYGHPLTASAEVALNPATPGVPIDGTVTFTDAVDGGARTEVPGCMALPVPASSNGRVDCTIARPAAGTHSLRAEYGAGNQTEGSVSTEQDLSIAVATPRATLTADPPGGSSAGQFVALTGRVELSDGTSDHVAVLEGTATFRDQGVDIPGCVDLPVDQPTVTCSLQPSVTTGGPAHSFTVHHTGSTNLTPVASAALSYAVGLAATSTTLERTTPATGTVPAGTPLTVTATVASSIAGVSPAGSVAFFDNGQPIAACPPPRPVDAAGTATCTFVPSAGTSHALTAAYQPTAGGTTAASTTTSALAVAVGRFASSTSIAVTPVATPTTPVVGDDVVLTATVTTSGSAPLPTGSVAFRDGGASIAGCGSASLAPVAGSSPAAATATCSYKPVGGSHSYRAVYGGDVPTGSSTSTSVNYTVRAAATTTDVSATPTGPTELTLVATVAPTTGSAIPTGSVDFGVDGADATDGCGDVPLVATAGGATASCTWTGDPTAAHSIEATYAPAGADFTASTGSFAYDASVECRAGEVALWAELDDTPGGVVVNDGHSRLTVAVPDGPGPCGAVPVPFSASSISLFGGMLTGNGSGVLTGAATNSSLCLTEGTLTAPVWMNVPTLSVSAPICWVLDDEGNLGASTQGELTVVGDQFPFVGLDDAPATAASFTFSPDGPDGASQLLLRFVAGPSDAPVLDLSMTVAADGSFAGTLDTPGLELFGQSLSTLHAEISGGAGTTLRLDGSVTVGPIEIADGVTIDELTVALSTDGFSIDGIASVGVGEHVLHLAAAGTVTNTQNWSLDVSALDTETWEPLPGLALSPNLRGSISRTDGDIAFDIVAGDPEGSPLVAWQPAAGASITVQTIQISSDGAPCAAVPDDPEHEGDLVLGFAGEVSLSGTTVAIDGCADLSIGAYHLEATASEIVVTDDLVVSDLELTADGAVGAGLELTGSGDATVAGHDLRVQFALATSGALVVGASADLTEWGVPVQGFVAYTSAAVEGFDTGDPTVGDDGVVDLEPGLTAVALWTPDTEADALLSAPAPDGLGLSAGGGIRFTAQIGPDALVFSGEIEAPTDLPFLTLPGGTTIDEASLTFTREGTDNTLALHVGATVQATTAVTVDLVLGLSDGSFTGEVDVTDLQLFGRSDIALHGTIERARNDAGVMEVQASVSGSAGSEAEPIEVSPSVLFTRLDLTLGTGGIAVAGDVVIAGGPELSIAGRVYTKADPVAGFGAGGWSLAVSTSSPAAWSPTDGVTFTADLTGQIQKMSSATPVRFRLTAAGPDGTDLFTFTPGGAPVTLAVRDVVVANESPAPAACAARPGDLWLSISGSLTATIAGNEGTATASGCFDLTSGAMSVSADLSAMNVDLGGGVRVHGPRFTVSRAASTPPPAPGTSVFKVSAEVAIDLDILGKPFSSPAPGTASTRLTAQLSYSGSAVVVGVRANLGSYGLGGVGGDAYLYYASAPVTGFVTGDPNLSKVDPKTGATTSGKIDLVRGINFAARLTLPASVTEGLGNIGGGDGVDAPSGAVTAIGQIDTAAKAFTFKVQFKSGVGGQELLRTGNGTRLTLDDGFLKFTVKSGQTSFGLGIAASLHLPPVEEGGEETHVPLTGELSVSTTGITASLQLGTCGSPENGWRNAFGVDGLMVECAAIQGGISYAGVPTVGFFGKVTALPSDVATAIGYQQGAPMQFAFNLNPMMLSISIGEKNSDKVALRPLQAFGEPDFIQVRYASLYVAPTAVTIGQQTFPAGFGIGFQASIAGVDMNLLASVDPTTPSISMYASVSEIEIGALKLGPVIVDLLASPTEFHFEVEGTLSLGPGTFDIGPALRIGGELDVSVRINILESGFEATLWGHAAMELSALLPQEMCWWYGQFPIPCNYDWDTTSFDVTLAETGFAVDGQGISLIAAGYRVTMLYEGGITASAVPVRTRSSSADPSGAALASTTEDPTAVATNPAPITNADEPVDEADEELEVAAPEASDEPMAAAPLPEELVVAAARLIDGTSIMAPPSGPNPAGDIPTLETTTLIEIDPNPVPSLTDGLASGDWTATQDLGDARTGAAIASLPDGRVLVAGGAGVDGPLASAEIYDPTTGTWTPTGALAQARSGSAVAMLADGRVLLAGGSDGTEGSPGDHALASVELYDPATGQWTSGPALGAPRSHATTTVLADGSVLVAGGLGPDGSLATAERYDPASGAWHPVGSMATARGFAAASLLDDGRVLVAGGFATNEPIDSAEVFDPSTETWKAVAAMPSASMLDTATTLADGRVLVAGNDARGKLYDPATDSWSWTGALGTVRTQATAVTLPDGDVLLIGGTAAGDVETDAEIYDAATNTWQNTTDLPVATTSAAAVVLPDGSVLAVGGADGITPLAAASIYRAVVVPSTETPAVTTTTTGQLPVTGADILRMVLVASLLLAAGAGIAMSARRRQA